jgi:hypothetical protein
MNGRRFRGAIGCVLNITSSIECDLGQINIFHVKPLGEK